MKLRKLRRRYSAAKTAAERERILEKVARIAPHVTKEEFLAPLRAQRAAAKEAPSPAR